MRFLFKIYLFIIFYISVNACVFAQIEYNNPELILINHSDSIKTKSDTIIPFAVIKGIITAGSPSVPIKAKISLIDRAESSEIKYIYNSHQKTGKYLMILAPGKAYDIIIEAKGHKSYYINIYLPEQTYFYELFQEIHLSPVLLNNNQIGEEISVNNIFHDILNPKFESNKDSVIEKDYSKLIKVIETMIEESNTVALENLELLATADKIIYTSKNKNYSKLLELIKNAIESSDSTTLNILNNATLCEEKTKHTYFYNKNSDNSGMSMQIFGKDTIWTFAPLNTIKSDKIVVKDSLKKRTEIMQYYVYFDIAKSTISGNYFNELNKIVNLMKYNKNIKLDINGYTDKLGNTEFNLKLSKERANAVENYFLSKKINKERIKATGYGAITDKKENRKVEILVYE